MSGVGAPVQAGAGTYGTLVERLLATPRADEQRQLLEEALPGLDPAALAELLKAEAEWQLARSVERSLATARLIGAVAAAVERRGGPATRIAALGLLAEADALRALGRYAEATAGYERAADLYRSVGDEVGWARTRIGLVLTSRYTGAVEAVLADVPRARAVLSEHRLWVRLARLESQLGALLDELGRGEEALAAYERALTAAARVEPPDASLRAEIVGNQAIAHYRLGNYRLADTLHAEAQRTFARAGEIGRVGQAALNAALILAAQGYYSKALAAGGPARRVLLQVGRSASAAMVGQLGVECLLRLNRPDDAADLAQQVAAEFERLGATVELAKTLALGSLALAALGRTGAALAALARAAELFQAGGFAGGLATVRLQRATVCRLLGDGEEALREATAAAEELARCGQMARVAEAKLEQARALWALGRPGEATAAARAALAQAAERGLTWLATAAWRLLGDLARAAGQADAALAAYAEAAGALEQVQGRILPEYRATYLADKLELYEALVRLHLERGEADQAFDYVERAKARALLDALAGGLDLRVRATTPHARELAEELAGLRRRRDRLSAALFDLQPGAQAPTEAAALRAELARCERRIGAVLEELRLAGAADLERVALLQGRVYPPTPHLEDGTLLVEYFSLGSDLAVFVRSARRLRVEVVPRAVPQSQRLLGLLRLNLDAAAAASGASGRLAALEANARTLLRRLYDLLLAPVAPWLAGTGRLVIVPHGPLHQVPFAALHDGERYLVEAVEIALAPSASALTFCRRPRRRAGQRALVVAHSAGGRLPGTLAEAEAVAGRFPGELLCEEAATVARVRALAEDADLVHLAAHGVARADAPLFSFLQLADGQLTALDCFDLALDCALVTLSACESGRGVVVPGDEPIGLTRALLQAGARAVLESLWRVDDRATAALMIHFYEALRAGAGRAAALRTAQLALLRGESGQRHPYFWAPLLLRGDWGPLDGLPPAADPAAETGPARR